jgi:hypothetical protein
MKESIGGCSTTLSFSLQNFLTLGGVARLTWLSLGLLCEVGFS